MYTPQQIEFIRVFGNKELTEEENNELRSIASGRYNCDRVWEAWQYGTMTKDDFSPLEEDENFYSDIASTFKRVEWHHVFAKLKEIGYIVEIFWVGYGIYNLCLSHKLKDGIAYTIDIAISPMEQPLLIEELLKLKP